MDGKKPIIGVGAVIFKGDEVLMIKRGKPPMQGQWSLPGGAQKSGESLREAVLREIQEETGLSVRLIAQIESIDCFALGDQIIDNPKDHIDHPDFNHFTLVDYAAHWMDGEPAAGDDAMDARWFKSWELDELFLWKETKRMIEKARILRDIRCAG